LSANLSNSLYFGCNLANLGNTLQNRRALWPSIPPT